MVNPEGIHATCVVLICVDKAKTQSLKKLELECVWRSASVRSWVFCHNERVKAQTRSSGGILVYILLIYVYICVCVCSYNSFRWKRVSTAMKDSCVIDYYLRSCICNFDENAVLASVRARVLTCVRIACSKFDREFFFLLLYVLDDILAEEHLSKWFSSINHTA